MSHIYDPLSRLDVPPPRHDVESDSEEERESDCGDDEVLGPYSSPPSPSSASSASRLVVSSPDVLGELRRGALTLLVGAAGEGVANALHLGEEASVHWRGRQVGSLGLLGHQRDRHYLLLYPGTALMEDLADLSSMTRALLKRVNPTSLELVDQYNPTLYINTQPLPSDDVAPIRYLVSASPSVSLSICTSASAACLPTPTHPFSPPNFLSHPTHTLSALLLQEAVYAGIPSRTLLFPSTIHQARPHARLIRRNRRRQKKTSTTSTTTTDMQGSSLLSDEGDFLSSGDEGEAAQLQDDDVDPAPLAVDLPGLGGPDEGAGASSGGEAKVKMTTFIETRRRSAARRRVVASGMYV